MAYYNAIVYTDYGTTITYHNVTNLDSMLRYLRQNISYTKVFLYKLPYRKAERGVYVAFHFPNMVGFKFKI